MQPFDGRRTTIAASAPEVRCLPGGKLEGATVSDHGFIILSLLFDASNDRGQLANDEYRSMCDDRKDQGYNSGMGEIFRRVAAVSPVPTRPLLISPAQLDVKRLRLEASWRGLDTRGVVDKKELVALLSGSMKAALRKLKSKELRVEAIKRGLDVKGVADKADLVKLLENSLGLQELACSASSGEYSCSSHMDRDGAASHF